MRKIAAQYLFPISSKPIQRGYVCLNDDGRITEIGELDSESESTEFYNGIICPGFVNSHCHIELSHLEGSFSQDSGMAGFVHQINEQRTSVEKKERIKAIESNMKKLYNSGVSAVADISNCDESFEIKSKSKLYTRSFLEVFGSEPKDAGNILKNVRELACLAESLGIDCSPTPHASYSMSRELLRDVSEEGIRSGFLSYHNQESWEEEELHIKGKGPIALELKRKGKSAPLVTGESSLLYFLDTLGKAGEKIAGQILLVHNTFTNEKSLDEAIARIENLYLAICPLSNIFIHRALPPINLFREKEVIITLGTDSLSSNTILSMADEILAIHRYFPSIPLEEILVWATINGAKFLKKEDDLGTFELGKRPGVVLIDNIDWQNRRLTNKSKSVRLV